MYQLISAIGEPLNGSGRWIDIEIGNAPINTIFSTYSKVYAILTNTFLDHEVSLFLEDIRLAHGGKTITFNQFLSELGNTSLPTSDTLPVLNTRYVRYADAFHAGYKVAPIHPTAAADADYPPADKTWLKLSRPDTDYALLYRSVLVSINGFFHQTDGDNLGVYVKDAMKSRTHSGEAQIGLHSFRTLGQLTFKPITEEMIYKQLPDQKYKDRVYVDLGEDTSDKTVMLVLGGYLHVLDKKSLYRVGNSQWCIEMGNLPLFDRYYESRKYLDLSGLPIERTNLNDSQIGVEDFLRDENLLAYLTLSQSFFVLLNNADVFVEREAVRKCAMPGMFISYVKPLYPLVAGVGKVAEYWYTHEDGQYSLTCQDTFRDQPVYNTVDQYAENSVADSRITQNPVRHSPAFFLKIGSDI